jgi:hypothetical protein
VMWLCIHLRVRLQSNPGVADPCPKAMPKVRTESTCHLRVEVIRGGAIGGDLGSIFHRAEVQIECPGRRGSIWEMGDSSGRQERDVWHSMLVNVRKSVELPQGVRRELIPFVVRLQPLDSCLRVRMDTPHFLAAFAGIHHPIAEDGELQTFSSILRQGINAIVGKGKFIN